MDRAGRMSAEPQAPERYGPPLGTVPRPRRLLSGYAREPVARPRARAPRAAARRAWSESPLDGRPPFASDDPPAAAPFGTDRGRDLPALQVRREAQAAAARAAEAEVPHDLAEHARVDRRLHAALGLALRRALRGAALRARDRALDASCKRQGIPTSPIVFIPFLGAVIGMRGAPRDAYVEAKVGLAGPILGSLGALVVFGLGEVHRLRPAGRRGLRRLPAQPLQPRPDRAARRRPGRGRDPSLRLGGRARGHGRPLGHLAQPDPDPHPPARPLRGCLRRAPKAAPSCAVAGPARLRQGIGQGLELRLAARLDQLIDRRRQFLQPNV